MGEKKARPFELDCQHIVWYKPMHAPNPGDPVFCVKCNAEARVLDHDPVRGTYYPDSEWTCYKVTASIVLGKCSRDGDNGCDFEYKGPFQRVQRRLERHHRLGCDSIDLLDIKTVTLPPNSPPPF